MYPIATRFGPRVALALSAVLTLLATAAPYIRFR